MIDFATHRQRLHAKIAAVHASRAQQALSVTKDGHEHDWKLYSQTVRFERSDEQVEKLQRLRKLGGLPESDARNNGRFIVKGCATCKAKLFVDYEVLPAEFGIH